MHTKFTQYYRIPLLILFVTVVWLLIGIRLWTFLRFQNRKWGSLAGTSILFTLFAGVLSIVYVALNLATFVTDQALFKFYNPIPYTAEQAETGMDPSKMSLEECRWVIKRVIRMLQMVAASRALLVITLWLVKASILSVYLDAAGILRQYTRWVVRQTAPLLLITGVLATWITIQSLVIGETWPTVDDIRHGAYVSGVTFIVLDDDSELAVVVLNIVTDTLLLFIAYKTIKALQYQASVGWLLYLMGTVTICLALIRVIFVMISISCVGTCLDTDTLDRIMTPIVFLAECEAFLAIALSCLPGLRATLRREVKESI